MNQETSKAIKATNDIEFNIQCLEEWAKSCSDNRELKEILIDKVRTLKNRLKRLELDMDSCTHCGSQKEPFGTGDLICFSCNGFQSTTQL